VRGYLGGTRSPKRSNSRAHWSAPARVWSKRLQPKGLERNSAPRFANSGSTLLSGWHAAIKTARIVIANHLHERTMSAARRPKWKSWLNSARKGLVNRPEDGRWSSCNNFVLDKADGSGMPHPDGQCAIVVTVSGMGKSHGRDWSPRRHPGYPLPRPDRRPEWSNANTLRITFYWWAFPS